MTQPLTPLQSEIIAALEKGDKNQGALLDETQASSYPELNTALKSLIERGLISYHFTETTPPVLTYRAKTVVHWLRRT